MKARLLVVALLLLGIFCLAQNSNAQLPQTGAGAGAPNSAPPFTATTFNPNDGDPATFSNGNLTVVAPATGNWAFAFDGQISGKYYFEAHCVVSGGSQMAVAISGWNFGFGTPRQVLYLNSGQIYDLFLGTPVGGAQSYGAGDTASVAVDLTAKLIWYSTDGITWNGGGANPATGTGGIDISDVGPGLIVPSVFFTSATSDSYTMNFGATAFTNPVPAGFTHGWPQIVPAGVTWNPADATAGFGTLSRNLIIGSQNNVQPNGGIRTFSSTTHSSGKFYFEDYSQIENHGWIGIANSSYNLVGQIDPGFDANSIALNMGSPGTVNYNSTTLGNGPTDNSGANIVTIYQVAVDLTAQLFWVSSSGSGVWNAGGSANPATGVGGYSFSGITGPYYIAGSVYNSDTWHASTGQLNSQSWPFAFTPPSGFSAW